MVVNRTNILLTNSLRGCSAGCAWTQHVPPSPKGGAQLAKPLSWHGKPSWHTVLLCQEPCTSTQSPRCFSLSGHETEWQESPRCSIDQKAAQQEQLSISLRLSYPGYGPSPQRCNQLLGYRDRVMLPLASYHLLCALPRQFITCAYTKRIFFPLVGPALLPFDANPFSHVEEKGLSFFPMDSWQCCVQGCGMKVATCP